MFRQAGFGLAGKVWYPDRPKDLTFLSRVAYSVFQLNEFSGGSMARESTQHKLDRVRSPRVQITYDVEVGGAMELKELPFVVGVLGDFTGQPEQPLPKLKDRKFVEVNPDNFDTVLEGMKPHLNFSVENKLSEEPEAANLKVDLKFAKLEDFEPQNVARQVKPLKELLDLRTRLSDLRGSLQGNDKLEELLLESVGNTEKLGKLKEEMGRKGRRFQWLRVRARKLPAAAGEQVQEKSLLDTIVEEGRFGVEPASRERGKNLVKEFVAQVLEGSMTIARDAEMMINARIAQIDHLVSIQLNEVMHHASFQKLEGAWRGLKYLMDQSETGVMLKIRVLNCSKKELLKDLQRAPEFDQSALFKKVYEEEYGVFGGAPFGALVGDYEFGKHPEDIELLDQVSHVAAAAHAPFCTAASCDMLNCRPGQPWTPRATWPRSWIARSTPSGRASASRKIPATWPSPCLVFSAGCLTARTPSRWKSSTTKSTWTESDHSKYLWMNAASRPRLADDQVLLAVRHVRRHEGRGRRRPGDRPAGAQLLYRRG